MAERADLQLERFRLQSLHIEYNEEWLAQENVGPDRMEDYSVKPEFRVFERSDDGEDRCAAGEIMVSLSLHCEPARQDTPTRFDQIHIEVWGLFSLSVETPPEQVDALKHWNSVSILHGIARGQVMQATGSCIDGPFIMPSLNYTVAESSAEAKQKGPDQPKRHQASTDSET